MGSNDACIAFTFARPTESPTNDFRCALYDSAAPTTTQGSLIFCKSLNAPLVGDVSFTQRFANIDECDDFLLILKSAVATVARVNCDLSKPLLQTAKTESLPTRSLPIL